MVRKFSKDRQAPVIWNKIKTRYSVFTANIRQEIPGFKESTGRQNPTLFTHAMLISKSRKALFPAVQCSLLVKDHKNHDSCQQRNSFAQVQNCFVRRCFVLMIVNMIIKINTGFKQYEVNVEFRERH